MDLQDAFDHGFEAVKAYVDAELRLPPDLAAEVARAVRALHEAPQVTEAKAVPRVSRIERDDDGNLVPIYDTARAGQ